MPMNYKVKLLMSTTGVSRYFMFINCTKPQIYKKMYMVVLETSSTLSLVRQESDSILNWKSLK